MTVQLLTGEMPYKFTEEFPFNPATFIARLANDALFRPVLPTTMPPYGESFVCQCLEV